MPATAFAPPTWAQCKVHPDHHIVFDRSYYSLPTRYVGQQVWVRATRRLVEGFCEEELIKTHLRAPRRGTWVTDPSDYPPRAQAFLFAHPAYCRQKAEELGPHVAQMMDQILASPALGHLRKAQALLPLADKYGAQRLDEACGHLLAFECTELKRLKRLRAHGAARAEPLPGRGLAGPLPSGPRLSAPTRELRRGRGGPSMSLPAATLISQLKALKLGPRCEALEVRLAQAQQGHLGYLEFLQLLLQDEIERRQAHSLKLRLQRACFEEPKPLEGFDFGGVPGLNTAPVQDLAPGLFIERGAHMLLYGPAGVGKTHLAQALDHQACRQGRSTLFLKAAKRFRTLQAARVDNTWEAELRQYLSPDLLIIDDFGLNAMTASQAEDFYEIVAERHPRGSIIVTSNRPPADWLPLLPVMANSALDRLAHHAHPLVMKGESYRKRLRPQTQSTLTMHPAPTELSPAQ